MQAPRPGVYQQGANERTARHAAEEWLRLHVLEASLVKLTAHQLRRGDLVPGNEPDPVQGADAARAGFYPAQDYLGQSSFSATEHQPYVPATVQDVHAHMAEAQLARHPEKGWGLSKDAPPSLQAAVRQVAAWGRTTPAKRDERMRALQAMQLKLQPLTDQARQAVSPEHLQDPLAPKPHIAWLAAISLAYSLDERICFDAALGVLAVGDIPPSGAFPPLNESRCAEEEAKGDFDTLDHAAWNDFLAQSVQERWASLAERDENDPAREEAVSVWAATIKERDKGLINGPFSRSDLDARFGVGCWRGIRRFGVTQKGKCRPCDNSAESLHNDFTKIPERIVCASADFPARAAGLFVQALGAPKGDWTMMGGLDDVDAAFRRIACATPQLTVITMLTLSRARPFILRCRVSILGSTARRSPSTDIRA